MAVSENLAVADQAALAALRPLIESGHVMSALLLVLGLLAAVAVLLVARGTWTLARESAAADRFDASFWSGGDLAKLYRSLEADLRHGALGSVFAAGFRAFSSGRERYGASDLIESVRAAIEVARRRESHRLRLAMRGLSALVPLLLAVGLLGTTWCCIEALSTGGGASASTRFAAALLPLVVGGFAYSLAAFARTLLEHATATLDLRLEGFAHDFPAFLQRHLAAPRPGGYGTRPI